MISHIAYTVNINKTLLDSVAIYYRRHGANVTSEHGSRVRDHLRAIHKSMRRRKANPALRGVQGIFELKNLPEWLMTRGEGRAPTRDLQQQSPNFPPDLLKQMRRNVTPPGAATAMLNYYRANVLRLGKAAPAAAPIEVPTLLIWGEDDVYLSPALASGLEPFVSKLTVRRLPGVSHWVQQDAPELVNRLIAEWARDQSLI